jgi:hypothetical protein
MYSLVAILFETSDFPWSRITENIFGVDTNADLFDAFYILSIEQNRWDPTLRLLQISNHTM